MTWLPSNQKCTLKAPDSEQANHACQCYSKRLTLMQNDQQHCWTHILSTSSLDTLISSAFKISPLTSVLTQTTANITYARHCNPSPSSLILTLLNMDTLSKAQIFPVLLIPRHQPFISPLQSYLAKLLAQRKNFNNQPSSTKTSSLPSSSVSHLPSRLIRLALPNYQLTTTFCPLVAFLPSTSPHQHSSMTHHHSHRLLPAFHNSPHKRKASPCIYLQQ